MTPAAVGCDLSSTSEADDDSDDSDSNTRDMSGYHCRHCFSVCEYTRFAVATALCGNIRVENDIGHITSSLIYRYSFHASVVCNDLYSRILHEANIRLTFNNTSIIVRLVYFTCILSLNVPFTILYMRHTCQARLKAISVLVKTQMNVPRGVRT